MAKKQQSGITAKKSAWSSFSIWWGLLVFCVAIPLFLILFYFEDYSVYVNGLNGHIQSLGREGIQTPDAYKNAVRNNLLFGAEIYKGGMFGLAAKLYIDADMSLDTLEVVAETCLGVGIVCLALAVFSLIRNIVCAKKTSYEFQNNVLILKKGRLFSSAEELRRLVLLPGMSVFVKQDLKGKLLGYGDVIVSMGLGEAGEVVMTGVKKPRKIKKKIARIMKTQCMVNPYMFSPYMMMPYAMPPHTYINNHPQK